ncbi:MAG TPA: methyltransferase [Paludibacter sp.]
MSNPYFSFKQFTVFHHLCAMKVGIDGVLLGAWASVENANSILDIGSGSGLITLMLAQRSEAEIIAIDIDADAVLQTVDNVSKSPWQNRIRTKEISLQLFVFETSDRFDLIVSNPPYFVNSTKTSTLSRTTARHTGSLSHEALIENAKLLLKPTGRICLILPVNEGLQCVDFAENIGLFCTKQVTVFPKPGAVAKRLLLEFSLQPSPKIESELTIESNERHQYSPEFSALAKDFYLKL